MLGGYLQSTLSGEFSISVLDTFDMKLLTSIRHSPDTIIIDENVNGVCGDEDWKPGQSASAGSKLTFIC